MGPDGKPKIYGLTGGIASGKSLASRFFREAGIPVIDADQLARQLTAPGTEAGEEMLRIFGTQDRKQAREKMFSDAALRSKWVSYLHPLIAAESRKHFEALIQKGASVILYEAALIVETGRRQDFDGLIVIEAPRELRMQRLIQRDQVTREQAKASLAAQTSDEVRRAVATFLILNDSDEASLKAQVLKLSQRLLSDSRDG